MAMRTSPAIVECLCRACAVTYTKQRRLGHFDLCPRCQRNLWQNNHRRERYKSDPAYRQDKIDRTQRWGSKPEVKAKRRERHAATRAACFDILGRVCVRCGFDDMRALQFDHVNDDGYKHRKGLASHTSVFPAIVAANGVGFQTLCANCNWIKKSETAARKSKESVR